jgi:hypothetical protein
VEYDKRHGPYYIVVVAVVIIYKIRRIIKGKSCPCALTEHHAMKMYWGVDLELHAFLT